MSGGRTPDVLVIVLISYRAPCTARMAVALVAAIAATTGKEIGRDRIQEGKGRDRERGRENTKEVRMEQSLCSRSPFFASKSRRFLDGAFAYRIAADHAIEEGDAAAREHHRGRTFRRRKTAGPPPPPSSDSRLARCALALCRASLPVNLSGIA